MHAADLIPLAVLAAGYLLSCAIWPYRACRRCSGTGKLRSPFGRAFRHCPRCGNTGQRARIGHRIVSRGRR
jgi:hypothetical protein